MMSKLKLMGIALAIVLMAGGATVVQARDLDDYCRARIAHEEHELDKAIAKHGYYSRQADHERHELERLRAQCDAFPYRHD